MRTVSKYCFAIFALVSVQLFSQTPEMPKIYSCFRASGSINIDGKPDEASWKKALWSDDFVDIEGAKKPLPEFRTRMKMLWDDEALYIFAELEEPHVWASLRQRDQVIFYDNDFEVFIDPDGDLHNYFELEVNAFSTVFDLFMNRPYNAGGKPLIGWDIHELKCAVAVDGTLNDPTDLDKKWTIEAAIPWKALVVFAPGKRPPQQGEFWRMNFSRVQWETEIKNNTYRKSINPDTGKAFAENNWVWSQQGAINMHLPEKWGYVVFYDEPAPHDLKVSDIDKFYNEKLVLLDLYRQQIEFHKRNDKYAGSLYALNKQGRSTGQNIFIESTSRQFLISIKTESGNTVYIDHQKRIWVE